MIARRECFDYLVLLDLLLRNGDPANRNCTQKTENFASVLKVCASGNLSRGRKEEEKAATVLVALPLKPNHVQAGEE